MAFAVCLASGLRQAEAMALRWGDVNFTEGVITVRRTFTRHGESRTTDPKSGQRREVFVTDDLLGPLAEWEQELGRPSDGSLVLPGPDGGYLSPFVLLRQLRAAMKAAGVPELHPKTGTKRNWHSLRHSYGRKFYRAGRASPGFRANSGIAPLA